jgi:hypothetical protein
MKDVVTACYKELVGKGAIINNPMSIDKFTVEAYEPMIWTEAYNDTTPWSTVDTISDYLPGVQETEIFPPAVLEDFSTWKVEQLRQSSINAAFADGKSASVDALVELATSRSTLQGLRKPLAGLQDAVERSIVQLNHRDIARMRKRCPKALYGYESYGGDASSLWLEWRYGIGPMMHTIEDVSNEWHREVINTLAATGRAEREMHQAATEDNVATISLAWVKPGEYRTTLRRLSRDQEKSFRSGCLFRCNLTPQMVWGLTLSELPSVAWELVPLSFVYDWFLEVGNFIGAHKIVPGATLKASWCTETSSQLTTWYAENHAKSIVYKDGNVTKTYACSGTVSTLTTKLVQKNRAPDVSPSLLPTIDLDFRSYKHLVDAVALGFQRLVPILRKRRKKRNVSLKRNPTRGCIVHADRWNDPDVGA